VLIDYGFAEADSAPPALVLKRWKRYKNPMQEATPHAAIVLKDLQKFYAPSRSGVRAFLQPFERATRPALKGVTLQVEQGEAVALLGANGAGKSTILRIVATLLLPTSGLAFVSGHDTAKDPRAVRRSLGYHAGSDQGFYPRLTGRQNLLFFGQLNHLTRAEAQRRIAELGEKFHIADALDQQVRTLSSGTTQRLSLARALLHKPTVLLLDEPTRSLDAIAAAEFRRFLKSEILRRGQTSLLFASHTLPEVELLADRVAVIDAGRLLACDSPSNLKRSTGVSSLEEVFLHLTGHAAAISPGDSAS
jgi:ABC-type multidrug transport system ATPase subunit